VVIVLLTEKKFDYERFVGAGGMPSSHSATVCTLSVCIGRTLGFSSPEFAIAFVFSLIIMYDAAGVRRAAGQQRPCLIKCLITGTFQSMSLRKLSLKALGPYTLEVVVGAVIGLLNWVFLLL
jgi:acid phosphatase family membrane protein YuiD